MKNWIPIVVVLAGVSFAVGQQFGGEKNPFRDVVFPQRPQPVANPPVPMSVLVAQNNELPQLPNVPDKDFLREPPGVPRHNEIDVSRLKKTIESPAPKINADYFAKAFNLKVTTTTRTDNTLIVTLEFTKTVDDISRITQAFLPINDGRKEEDRKDDKKDDRPAREPDFYAYLFDKDNVAMSKATVSRVQGLMTGVSGDAFRIHINIGEQSDGVVTKIDIRPRVRQSVQGPTFSGSYQQLPSPIVSPLAPQSPAAFGNVPVPLQTEPEKKEP
jgi:hypothetical protein